MPIRWLHISDVHECDRDGYGRKSMFDAIITAVTSREEKPDFVFFTGDLAFSGTKGEYDLLRDRFMNPLRAALPDGCPIFTVPGNHDVNRKRGLNPRAWIEDEDERTTFQKVDQDGRQKRVDAILPRFEAYREIEKELGFWGDDWLASDKGAVCVTCQAAGHKVAIVGINTAWLCHNDEDWGRLTAGKTMVEATLKSAAGTELVIVLGHHPLAAMTGEKPWSDGERIRQRLQQANAIYLHGHLHKSGGQIASDSLQSVLAIQAPSGFQAADSVRWRNGIMWGEADLVTGRLIIEPLRWNDDHSAFVFDSDAAPPTLRAAGRDAFAYPLPGRHQPVGGSSSTGPVAPEGWQIIDPALLAEMTTTRPSAAEMADWFDGTFPSWEVATALDVRPRQIVDVLTRSFRAAFKGAPRPVVRLLTGAGGEGKSAALLQTAAGLLRDTGQTWSCLWRHSAAADLPAGLPSLLPRKDGHAWIIAIDDAEAIGKPLAEVSRQFGARTDVHVILAAREADWTLRGNTDAQWQDSADFRRIPLAGIDEEDARRIAEGWAAWGDAAMGHLRGQSIEAAAKALFGHAREFAAKEEGALLGALLMTREGEDYRQRVARLMAPLRGEMGIGKHSLLDIYAMIAAMHAENQLYLSRAVLAYALKCDESELDRGPLRTLRREAMVDGSTTYVLTRHRLIAEVARDWLMEEGYEVDRLYPLLARAGVTAIRVKGSLNPDLAQWRYGLAEHFLRKGADRNGIARAIALSLWQMEPNDPLYLTNYTNILRRTGAPQEAMAMFSENASHFPRHRGVLYEWGVVAGAAGDQGLSVWLDARSLADDRDTPLDAKRSKLSLAGLGKAFEELAQAAGSRAFARAQAACGRLGLHLHDLDGRTRSYFEHHVKAAPATGTPTIEADIEILRKAAIDASYEAEPDHAKGLDAQIGEPDSYRYRMLDDLLSGRSSSRR